MSMHVDVTLTLALINQLCFFYITHEGRRKRMSNASKKRYKRSRFLNVSCRLQYSFELLLRGLDPGVEEGYRKYWISL